MCLLFGQTCPLKFILACADRPFTDSEVRFLKYIRQWGKKVIFLVNKVDILSDSAEVGPSLYASLLNHGVIQGATIDLSS